MVKKILVLAATGMLASTTAMTIDPERAAAAAMMSRACQVDEVAVIAQRMHIKCITDPSKAFTSAIPYYAAGLAEGEAKIGGMVAIALEAQRRKVPLQIWFDMDDYKSVPGCQGNDCRKLVGAAID